jgi:xanthine/uracil permease
MATKQSSKKSTSTMMGYLPNDMPPTLQMILLGFQHVLTMFPATVFVAAFCGFHVGTVLFASGVSTIVALILSRRALGRLSPFSMARASATLQLIWELSRLPPANRT